MKEFLGSLRTRAIEVRIWFLRGAAYITLINTGMILFLFLARLKDAGYINIDIGNYLIPFFILGVLGMTFIGWFEIKFLRGLNQEQKRLFELTPPMVEMRDKINYLYEKERNAEIIKGMEEISKNENIPM